MDDAELDARLVGLSYEHRDSESGYRIRLERHGVHLSLVLEGSMLTPAPESFVEQISQLLGAVDRRGVLVEMSNCEYLSSSAISHIIRFADAASKGGCRVVMCGPQPKVKVVLDLLGLESVCPILADAEAAGTWFEAHGLAG